MRSNVFLLCLALSACGGSSSAASEPAASSSTAGDEALPTPDIEGAEAQRLVAEGAFLLDVTPAPRNAESVLAGRVNIPMPELEARMAEVPRDRTVIVYCFGGGGSPHAARMLRAAGYPDVRLLGAMTNWGAPATEGEGAPSP